MKNLEKYIAYKIRKMDEAETIEDVQKHGDRLHVIAGLLRTMRAALKTVPGESMGAAIVGANVDMDLEHFESMADSAAKRADEIVREMQFEEDDERIYGTYEQQVREQYNGGLL